jgi:hypothetical protein
MKWLVFLCAIKWLTIALAFAVAVCVTAIVAHGAGYMTANRRYWKMMHRAGSKITRDF